MPLAGHFLITRGQILLPKGPLLIGLLFHCAFIVFLLCSFAQAEASSGDRRNLLDELLKIYDIDKWPTFQEGDLELEKPEPTRVIISIDIMFISSIDVQAMDLTIDFYLNQRWVDNRLAFPETLSKKSIVLRTVEQIKRVWTPDTYMVNAKSANFHDVTTPNRYLLWRYCLMSSVLIVWTLLCFGDKLVYIDSQGNVMYSARITAKLACQMHFAMYPVDTQICDLHLASYAYQIDHLVYEWQDNGSVTYRGTQDLNQFTLSENWTCAEPDHYPDGYYPALQVKFRFRRNFGHHLIQTYLPTVLIVTISWVSFFLEAGAVPARVSLGITTFLTMITLNSGAKVGLPPVSYVKAIDIWMLACTFFVFSTLWHFVLVCVMSRRPMPGQYGTSSRNICQSGSASFCVGTHHHRASHAANDNLMENRLAQRAAYGETNSELTKLNPDINNVSPTTTMKNRSDSVVSEPIWVLRAEMMAAAAAKAAAGNSQLSHRVTSSGQLEDMTSQKASPGASAVVPRRKKLCRCSCTCFAAPSNAKDRAKRIDVYARWLYPLVFLLFNLVYWFYYLYVLPIFSQDITRTKCRD